MEYLAQDSPALSIATLAIIHGTIICRQLFNYLASKPFTSDHHTKWQSEEEFAFSLFNCLRDGTLIFSCLQTLTEIYTITSHGSQAFGHELEVYHRLSWISSLLTVDLGTS